MLTGAERRYCALLAKPAGEAMPRSDCFAEAFGREPRKGELEALHERSDVEFEVQCRSAARTHATRIQGECLEELALDVGKMKLLAQRETYVAVVGAMQLLQEVQAQHQRPNPAEAKLVETCAKVADILGADAVNINMPAAAKQTPEELVAEMKALEREIATSRRIEWDQTPTN